MNDGLSPEVRERVVELLLAERKDGGLRWFYVSIADHRFHGGYFIKAFGPTDAWCLIHQLGWYTLGCSTETSEIDEHRMERVPDSMRWRKLSLKEVRSL